jgi:predicted enzyme related to lactoylglutathione lyase
LSPLISSFFVLKYSAGLTTIATINFDRMVAFYAELLHQSPDPYQPGIYAGFRLPGLELGIFQPAGPRQEEFDPPSRSLSLCLELLNLDEAFTELAQADNTPISAMVSASHGREFYIADPDGNRIILHQNRLAAPSISASEP